jgi:putative membrane protein
VAFVDVLPTLNATLNGASAVCIFTAWRMIRAGRADLHKRFMLAAVGLSSLFLVFYLIRFGLTGAHRYPVQDWTRTLYLVVLGTHTLLAATVPFLVVRAIFLALKGRFPEHRRVVRFALPVWGYVSVTGVVVYLMLYHLAPARL